MDEDKRYRVTVLADAYHSAKLRLDCIRMSNTRTDPEEARKQTIEYALAWAEYCEAERRLEEAVKSA